MRKILLTTALLTAMSSMPVLAQSAMPSDFVAPEGYQSATADSLTFQDLMGATVYDIRGESIGDISDFVMEGDAAMQGASGMSTGASTGTSTGASSGTSTDTMGASDTTTATSETSTTATDGNVSNGTGGTTGTTGTATEGAATDSTATGTDGMATGTTTTDGATATDSTATGSDSSTTATDSSTTGTTMTESTSTATDSTATGTMSTDGSMSASATGDRTGSITGQASHAIIDVGGFLGMGTRTVAIPIEALQVFRGQNASDVRVYLPWNEDQLKQIPEYVDGDMSTLGTMDSVSQ